jgi:hypothetical protein
MVFCFSCKKTKPPAVSFYYWKTKFALHKEETATLQYNKVQQLYVRYFDVAFDKERAEAKPVGVIQIDSQHISQQIVPVIYIKNEVFQKANPIIVDTLCNHIFRLVQQISKAAHQQPTAIQFDCDWTFETKEKYFLFLQQYKTISHQNISATIRLHQVKHANITGIPPVDHGVLMFYNMGQIAADNRNSIFEEQIALSYLDKLEAYPLRLDIALPIFSWGIQIRNKQVIHLLNKMNARHFDQDTCFQKIREGRYRTVTSCFKGGYYFLQNDEVKVEQITPDNLKTMANLCRNHFKQNFQQIIFYDLDSFNLDNYEKEIYQQTARLFN